MLFETLKQGYIFLGCLYFGLILGIFFDFCKFNVKLFKNKFIIQLIFDIIFSICAVIIFFYCLNIVNFGEFRIFVLFSFILGFIIEQKNLGFLVDFVFQKIYNFLRKIFEKLSKTKFIKRIFGFDTRKSKVVDKNK